MRLETFKQTKNSCLLLSSCIILNKLTGEKIEDLMSLFNEYFIKLGIFFSKDDGTKLRQKIKNQSNEEEIYDVIFNHCLYNSDSKVQFQISQSHIKNAFFDLCKKNKITIELVDFKAQYIFIENELKNGNSFLSLSFRHKNVSNEGWHITSIGYENGQFYTSETNLNTIIIIGNSIFDIKTAMINIYMSIIDLGDGLLYKKLN